MEYGLFLARTLTAVIAVLAVVGGVLVMVKAARAQRAGADHLEVKNLNERFRDLADAIRNQILDEAALKKLDKTRKTERKAQARAQRDGTQSKPRIYALKFHGDLQASAVESLREEISAVLQVARPGTDEVMLRLDSEGGMVHGYGLAASQLVRLREAGVRLTVAVDKVAASGGYMMACVANHIIAAPFAIVGSIGVVAQLPNFNRLLKRMDVDFELHTAGAYKRTLTLFGENTEAARDKFRAEIEETHALFKQFVGDYRPSLDLARVATGEHWFGLQALDLKLVDKLQTSDDYLLTRVADAELFELRFRRKPRLAQRLSDGLVRLGLGLRRSVEETTLPRWQ